MSLHFACKKKLFQSSKNQGMKTLLISSIRLFVRRCNFDIVLKPALLLYPYRTFSTSCSCKDKSILGDHSEESQNNLNNSKKFKSVPNYIKRPSATTMTENNKKTKLDEPVFKSETDDLIIWVDCEMTGLDAFNDSIIEIGCIVTGPDLKEIARHPPLVANVPDHVLNNMNTWCVQHHGESGLTERVQQSKLTHKDIDRQLADFLKQHVKAGSCPMAGNSIYMDRFFIARQFPEFHSYFHYRNIDVSSIKEITRRWFPKEYQRAPAKRWVHRVTEDIEDSIDELKYYRSSVFKSTSDT